MNTTWRNLSLNVEIENDDIQRKKYIQKKYILFQYLLDLLTIVRVVGLWSSVCLRE